MAALTSVPADFNAFPHPRDYPEAARSEDKAFWVIAKKVRLQSLASYQIWKIVKLESWMFTLHSKWMLKKKRNGDGGIERYKARLVVSGNNHVLVSPTC